MIRKVLLAFAFLPLLASAQRSAEFEAEKKAQLDSNQHVLDVLIREGDQLIRERDVFHWVFFRTKSSRTKYLKEVEEEGFVLVESDTTDDETFKFSLQIRRKDKVDKKNIDEVVAFLWEKARDFDTEYDGWETSIEK